MEKEFYTSGELAKLTGVSYKTIRHYCDIGLLVPDKYSDHNYKLYSAKAVEQLQRMLMLKYLNFSLEEIKEILLKEDISNTFTKQEKYLKAQAKHLEQILKAVQEIQAISGEQRWEKILEIIHMTQQKEEINKQYLESNNLQKRINIHVYSTSKVGWYQWVMEGLQLKDGMKIMELGCGNGMLWLAMREQLPVNLQIYMIDNSDSMLEDAKKNMQQFEELFAEKNIRFIYGKKDIEELQIEESEFDRIIANHVLYHVSNQKRKQLLETCKRKLTKDGFFYASTVGNTHLRELFSLVQEFDHRIDIPNWMTKDFELENGGTQLEQVFSKVIVTEQQNDLLVPNPQAIYDYVDSWPGNVCEILHGRKEEWIAYSRDKVTEEHPYFIHKSTGAFKAFVV